jgi:hypothetical protein
MNRYKLVLATASLLTVALPAYAQRVDGARPGKSSRAYGRAPEIEVWIDRYVFRSGERIHTYFETEPGAYVTILRITTLGDVTVLYPRRPTTQRAYRDELINDEIPAAGRREFYINEPEGVGFVFAIASFEPFDYRGFTSGGQWNTMRLAGFGYGDPYRAVDSFVSRTVPARAEYSTDYIQYEVLGDGGYNRYGYAYGNTYGNRYYNDHYFRCLEYYGLNAVSYCHSYAGSGIGGFPFIVVAPPARPNPTTPSTRPVRRPNMPPPGKVIPDPGVVAGADASGGASSAEASSSARYTDLRGRPASPGTSTDGNQRIERRQRPQPEREDQPYIIAPRRHEPEPVQRFDPPPTQRAEPPATQRYEPPPAPRYEPPRVEQRQEPRPAPVIREHPVPVTPPPPPPPPAQ